LRLNKQLRLLALYNVLAAFRIADAVWVLFLLRRGFSLAQAGLAEGLFHVVSLLCEVPSGMAADLFGRRRTLAVSGLCGLLSGVAMALSENFFGVCVSMALCALMYNFASGTLEAITYDSLIAADRRGDYLRVSAFMNGLSRTSAAVSCVLGALALALGFVRAYLLSAALCGALAALALALAEPAVTAAQRAREARPFADLPARLRAHAAESVRFLRRQPRAGLLILADGAVGVPIYLTFMFAQRHFADGGLPAAWLGAVLLGVRLAGTAGVALGARGRGPLARAAAGFCLLAGAGTLLAGLSRLWPVCALGAAAASLADGAADLRLEARLNDLFPSDRRATLVSVNSMVYSLLMIAVSPLAGAVGDRWGAGGAIALTGALLLLGTAAALLLRAARRRA